LLRRRYDGCCYPLSLSKSAFLKDALLLKLARMFGVPTVLYAHGNNLPEFWERSTPRVRRWIERTCRAARAGIVLGESLRFNFERWLPPERIFAVPTGIEPAPVRPRSRRAGVLYLGALVREKGVFVLLEAARRCPDVPFVFAGEWHRPEEEAQARRLAGANVTFIGPVTGEAKAQALADAELLAFPTFYPNETMGLVLLEAMQAGLPVVTTRRGAIPEIVQDGVHGFFVNEQDPVDLAEKIRRLTADPGLRQRMGEAGRRRYEEFYTHEHYGRRMIAVFEELARG
jgi:glycosyltransferase involved in cell wall biosynthesis